MTKQEILYAMQKARSWKELGLTIKEVYDAFSDGSELTATSENGEAVQKLKGKIDRLSEANKALRAENKALRGEK